MTLPRGTDRLESPRLVLRRMRPDDLPFYTRIHALPEVARYLWPEGRPRLPYAVSAIHPQNARSQRVAERSGARAAGRMEAYGMTWDRWVWPLATGQRGAAYVSGTGIMPTAGEAVRPSG